MRTTLENILKSEDIAFDDEKISKLLKYKDILQDWNTRMNLTAIDEDEEIFYKHFLDSLLVLKIIEDFDSKKVADIGTGAGFPGIPLKIFSENIELDLVDSLNKRLIFLDHLINELELKGVSLHHNRAEFLGQDKKFREKYDYVFARAVARLPILLELCLPLVKPGGYFLALKGPEGEEELKESEYSLKVLGAELFSKENFNLYQGKHQRNIYVFKKTKKTPKKYPRRAGTPQKSPLLK